MNTSRSNRLNAPCAISRDVSGPPVTAVGYMIVPDEAADREAAANKRWYRDITSPSVMGQGAIFLLLSVKKKPKKERNEQQWVFMKNW